VQQQQVAWQQTARMNLQVSNDGNLPQTAVKHSTEQRIDSVENRRKSKRHRNQFTSVTHQLL